MIFSKALFAIWNALSGKADKVIPSVYGNYPILDDTGNLIDSGTSPDSLTNNIMAQFPTSLPANGGIAESLVAYEHIDVDGSDYTIPHTFSYVNGTWTTTDSFGVDKALSAGKLQNSAYDTSGYFNYTSIVDNGVADRWESNVAIYTNGAGIDRAITADGLCDINSGWFFRFNGTSWETNGGINTSGAGIDYAQIAGEAQVLNYDGAAIFYDNFSGGVTQGYWIGNIYATRAYNADEADRAYHSDTTDYAYHAETASTSEGIYAIDALVVGYGTSTNNGRIPGYAVIRGTDGQNYCFNGTTWELETP